MQKITLLNNIDILFLWANAMSNCGPFLHTRVHSYSLHLLKEHRWWVSGLFTGEVTQALSSKGIKISRILDSPEMLVQLSNDVYEQNLIVLIYLSK